MLMKQGQCAASLPFLVSFVPLPLTLPAPSPLAPPAPHLAGPVLVDIPKDVQQTLDVPDWDAPMAISAYMSRLPPPPQEAQMAKVIEAIRGAKRPVLYVGGGCVDSRERCPRCCRCRCCCCRRCCCCCWVVGVEGCGCAGAWAEC